MEQKKGGLQIFQTAIVDTAGKQEKVSSANCFYKIVKEVIIFPNTCLQYKCVTIDWAREDDEKDAGIVHPFLGLLQKKLHASFVQAGWKTIKKESRGPMALKLEES